MAKMQANIVLEILGRPAEHLKEALNGLIDKISSENGIKLIEKTAHEPAPVKDAQDLFTSFAELTLEFDSLSHYLGILFAYMPAHTELISPEKISFTNADINDLANKIILRLHEYDAITKKALVERSILLQKLNQSQASQQNPPPAQPTIKKPEKKKKKPKRKK